MASRRLLLNARLAKIKILLCDVDGVLTDASVFIGGGQEIKRFNILDGLGLVLLRRVGIKVGWISCRPSPATKLRAKELKIDFLVQQKNDKVAVVERILARTGFTWAQVCYVGDDVVDLGVLKRAGLAVVVVNGVTEAKAAAHYVTKVAGGHGAVREVAEMILKAQYRWAALLAQYSA
jgi:3-deoxy-D-manno-octulosonate 8-phosphate phosphatase (KDO 8-P phosphatase)